MIIYLIFFQLQESQKHVRIASDEIRGLTDKLKRVESDRWRSSPKSGRRAPNVSIIFKGKDYCPIEIIKGLTDKGQFHYLTKLKGPQVGNYLYTAQFLPPR